MEVLLLTSVIITLFLVFIIATWRELDRVSSVNYKFKNERPTGGRYALINLLEDSTKPKIKKNKNKKIKAILDLSTISDMESNGVYSNN